MARDGTGTFNNEGGYPYQTGTTIDATQMDLTLAALGDALTASIAKDGQTTPSNDLPMGTHKHTGVGNASARTHYPSAGQIQDGSLSLVASIGGTADALTGSLAPAILAYTANMQVGFVAASSNATTTPTLALNGLTAKTIVREGGIALVAGDIVSGKFAQVIYDGTNFVLMNPATTVFTIPAGTVTLAMMANLAQDQFIGRTTASTGVPQTATVTAFARTVLDDVDAATARSTLGLGTLATQNGTFSGTSSGTNTGDQTNISGNAATATTAASCSGNAATATTASSCSGNSATATSATSATNATNTPNITGKSGTTKTLSTSAASGGSDGDIWYRY